MAWIKVIAEEDAHDYLRTLYKKYGDPFEGVDNILKIHSLDPKSLQLHYDTYKHLMTGKSGLSSPRRRPGLRLLQPCQPHGLRPRGRAGALLGKREGRLS